MMSNDQRQLANSSTNPGLGLANMFGVSIIACGHIVPISTSPANSECGPGVTNTLLARGKIATGMNLAYLQP